MSAGFPESSARWFQRQGAAAWELVVGATAVGAAAAATWITLNADFLAHPGWLALQKADLILGPVFVGLYWHRRRPGSRYGPLLIGCGAVGAWYVLESSPDPVLFNVGLLAEPIEFLVSLTLILAFPTGRLERWPERLLFGAALLLVVAPYFLAAAVSPALVPTGTISGCRAGCPANGLLIDAHRTLGPHLVQLSRGGVVAIAVATLALLGWRLATGTPSRRRAFVIGAPIAVFFLTTATALRLIQLLDVDAPRALEVLGWALVVSRSAVWYGFLFALIAAQLFAGRVLQRIVGESLRRPSLPQLEELLRGPMGDPALRLVFRQPTGAWRDAGGARFALPSAVSGRAVTEVERMGRPPVAIVHDAQLSEEPELLRAAGAVALLAAENVELEAAWNAALADLRDSRARIVVAGDRERRKLERNLHDGVQQRLVAVHINLAVAGERLAAEPAVRDQLDGIGESIVEAMDELREVAHGLYPPVLGTDGLLAALALVARHSPAPVTITGEVGRHAAELESAVYYCCLEALTNAGKHAETAVGISIQLHESADEIRFAVSDDGGGFDASRANDGTGLENMQDRLGALGGQLSIISARGHGTTVSGAIPLTDAVGGTPVLLEAPLMVLATAAERGTGIEADH